MSEKDYYTRQLNIINTTGEYAATFQFRGADRKRTKNMDLNTESAKSLISWLEKYLEEVSQ